MAAAPLHIISLTAENIKKLVAVHIEPDGNVIEITGRNGQGKTSVLDCIWWAIEGAKHIQTQPVRKGADKARIRLDLGEIIVERRFTATNGAGTLSVTTADGAKYGNPQKILDDLYGALTFDPLAFTKMKASEQFKLLTTLVPLGVDVAALNAANRETFAERTGVNRDAKALRARVDAMPVASTLRGEPIDIDALIATLETAAEGNAAIERRKAARADVAGKVETARLFAQKQRSEAADCRKRADAADAAGIDADNEADVQAARLAAAPPLPEPVDTTAVREKITAARADNTAFEAGKRRSDLVAEARDAEAQADMLTEAMEARTAEIADALAAAKMPVPGLSLGDDAVLLDDLPFEQASGRDQLRVSLAVAMAANPRLRVIRIADGSLLDTDGMAIIADMAAANNFQVWIERVDMSGKVGFVIEDGAIVHVPAPLLMQAAE
jgi:energy-coupling factor transporter ATP-binding protein EcfA2